MARRRKWVVEEREGRRAGRNPAGFVYRSAGGWGKKGGRQGTANVLSSPQLPTICRRFAVDVPTICRRTLADCSQTSVGCCQTSACSEASPSAFRVKCFLLFCFSLCFQRYMDIDVCTCIVRSCNFLYINNSDSGEIFNITRGAHDHIQHAW